MQHSGARAAIEQAGREEGMVLLGGSGMNRVIKMIMDGDKLIDANIFYPPTLIAPAIEITGLPDFSAMSATSRWSASRPP